MPWNEGLLSVKLPTVLIEEGEYVLRLSGLTGGQPTHLNERYRLEIRKQ